MLTKHVCDNRLTRQQNADKNKTTKAIYKDDLVPANPGKTGYFKISPGKP